MKVDVVLKNSFGFGGSNHSIVYARYWYFDIIRLDWAMILPIIIINYQLDDWYWRVRLVDPNRNEEIRKPDKWVVIERVQLEIDIDIENQLDSEKYKHTNWKLWYGNKQFIQKWSKRVPRRT